MKYCWVSYDEWKAGAHLIPYSLSFSYQTLKSTQRKLPQMLIEAFGYEVVDEHYDSYVYILNFNNLSSLVQMFHQCIFFF